MRKKASIKSKVITKDFRCTICSKSGFSSTYKLKAHLFLHKAVPARYKCTYCPKEYFRSDEYSRHIASHQKTQKQYTCDHCGRSFVDKRNLIMHLNVHDDMPRHPDLRYRCVACGADYCEERLLKYHIRKTHFNLKTSEPIHTTKKINDTWIEKVKDTRKYVEITKVKQNTLMIKKSKIRSFKDINYADDKDMFQQYISSVFAAKDNHYSKAVCDYCGKAMLKKSIVKHIRERHLKLRRFNCDGCKKSFMRHYQLCLHKCGQDKRRKVKAEKSNKKFKVENSIKVKVERSPKQIKVEKTTLDKKLKLVR